MSTFVKSATTTTAVAKTQADMIAMLGRYGASGFGFRRTGDRIEVTFHIPASSGADRSVCIPVNVDTVLERLAAPPLREARQRQKRSTQITADQAERVAWRILYLWIDAALSAVSLGAQTLEEAFFAHLLVTTEDGQQGRVVDYITTLGGFDGGRLPAARRLLSAGGGPR